MLFTIYPCVNTEHTDRLGALLGRQPAWPNLLFIADLILYLFDIKQIIIIAAYNPRAVPLLLKCGLRVTVLLFARHILRPKLT